MSDAITTLLVQIKVDATGVVAAFRDLATGTSTAAKQVKVLDQSMAASAKNIENAGTAASHASGHMAGMTYAVRSLFDQIRFGVGAGGKMAGFYAIDEAVRAMLANKDKLMAMGLTLSRLFAGGGIIATAILGGMFAWHEWNKVTEDAAKHAKELADAWKELPGLMKQIQDMQDTGLLGPRAAQQYRDFLTGKKPLYVDERGNVTTQATHQEPEMTSMGGEIGGPPIMTPTGRMLTIQNQLASLKQAQDYFKDQSSGGGELVDEQLKAISDLAVETRRLHEEGLQGIEREKAAMEERYAAERKEIQENLDLAKAKLGTVNFGDSTEVKNAQAALAQSYKDEQAEIAAAEQKYQDEQLQKLNESYKANKEIVKLLGGDFETALRNVLELQKKETEEIQRELQLEQQIAYAQSQWQLRGIEGNPFLTNLQKAQQSIPIYQGMLSQNQSQMESLANQQEQAAESNDTKTELEAKRQILELAQQNLEIEEKLHDAQGQNNFGYQFGKVFTDQQDKWKGWAQESADSFSSAWNGATNSVADGFTHLFEYGRQKGQWWRETWNGMIGSMISSVTHLAVDFIAQHVIMDNVSAAFDLQQETQTAQNVAMHVAGEQAKTASTIAGSAERTQAVTLENALYYALVQLRVAAHIAGEAAATAATYAYAILRAMYHAVVAAIAAMESEASVPYVGVVLGIAAAAAILGAAYGLMGGFQEGGWTGNGPVHGIAGVVHGQEWVTPAHRINASTLPLLQAIHRGDYAPRFNGGSVSSPAQTSSSRGAPIDNTTDVHLYMDKQKMIDEVARSDANRQFIVDVMSQNIHKFRS